MTTHPPSAAAVPAAEFSRPLALDAILPTKDRRDVLTATPEESSALARRFGLKSLSNFKAKVSARRVPDGLIRIWGELEAEVVQACVVSLQDVPARIRASFDTYFTEEGREVDDEALEGLLPEEDDDTVFQNGAVDLGELTAQYLALELDPFPRAPGVSLAAQMTQRGERDPKNPFAVLESLKPEDEDQP